MAEHLPKQLLWFQILFCSVYSVSIFCKIGADGYTGTVVLMVFNFCSQIFGIFVISKVHICGLTILDTITGHTTCFLQLFKCGRKPLLLLGVLIMGGALASAGTLIRAVDLEETLELNLGRTIAGYVVIALVTLYISANTSTIAQVISRVCSHRV